MKPRMEPDERRLATWVGRAVLCLPESRDSGRRARSDTPYLGRRLRLVLQTQPRSSEISVHPYISG